MPNGSLGGRGGISPGVGATTSAARAPGTDNAHVKARATRETRPNAEEPVRREQCRYAERSTREAGLNIRNMSTQDPRLVKHPPNCSACSNVEPLNELALPGSSVRGHTYRCGCTPDLHTLLLRSRQPTPLSERHGRPSSSCSTRHTKLKHPRKCDGEFATKNPANPAIRGVRRMMCDWTIDDGG